MKPSSALIGFSGFVGSQLAKDLDFTAKFRSTNINDIQGQKFSEIICAGVQAVKWWANQNPEEDWQGIERLLKPLAQCQSDHFTLISSIDVYNPPRKVDEDSTIPTEAHHAYGLHRLKVEQWVKEHFPNHLILRLPGLFGPGLKKNVIFDMIHDNQLDKVHPDGCFQYYDTRRLASDIAKARQLNLTLLNLSSEPILTSEIRDQFFPDKSLGGHGPPPPSYDMRSKYASHWQGENGYLYSKTQVLTDLKDLLTNPI